MAIKKLSLYSIKKTHLLKGFSQKPHNKILTITAMSNYPDWLPKEQFEEVRREGINLSKHLSSKQQADFIDRISKAKTEDVIKELLSMDLTKGAQKIVRAIEGKHNRNEREIDSGTIRHESYLKELGYLSKLLFELVKPHNDLVWIPKKEMGLERRSEKILMIGKMTYKEQIEHTKKVGTYDIYMTFIKEGVSAAAKKMNLDKECQNYHIELNEALNKSNGNPIAVMRRFRDFILEKICFPDF